MIFFNDSGSLVFPLARYLNANIFCTSAHTVMIASKIAGTLKDQCSRTNISLIKKIVKKAGISNLIIFLSSCDSLSFK